MLSSQSVLLILALAVTIPLRSGDFDLSIAATMNLAASIVAVLIFKHHFAMVPATLVALAVGAGIGVINGILIVGIGVNAFVATLGTMTAIGGLTYGVTNNAVISGLTGSILSFSRLDVLGLPVAVVYGWGLAIIVWYVFEYTPVGRYLLFVGGNREASRLTGLPVRRLRFLAFVFAGLLSAFAGVLLAGTLGAADPSAGPQYLLPPYAAAFLGTTTIQVGRFNVVGTVVALYLLVVGVTGLVLLGAASWISDVFNGTALVLAVVFARLVGRGEVGL
jgi:ribose transport system permease protein